MTLSKPTLEKSAAHELRVLSRRRRASTMGCAVVVTFCVFCIVGTSSAQTSTPIAPTDLSAGYVLGPDDQITVRALEVEEIDGKTARVDLQGYIDLPLIGKVKAAGSSVDAVEAELSNRLRKYVREPRVTVTVSEYHSQPVSVLGAVNTPGVYNLTGPNTLEQVLSRAGGLRN